MKLSEIFDKKFNFLRKINDEIIDNPLKDMVDDYDEYSEEDDWEEEDTEEGTEDDSEFEEYIFNGSYNLSNCLPYTGMSSLINKDTLSLYFPHYNKYVVKFNDEHLNRSYFVNNISCNNDGYCSFDVLNPDDFLTGYLIEKTNSFFEPRYVSKKDCCIDITIQILDVSGTVIEEFVLYNAILNTINNELSYTDDKIRLSFSFEHLHHNF